MMRSCGTPWSIKTSIALIADPPVAATKREKVEYQGSSFAGWLGCRLTKHRVEEEGVAVRDVVGQLGVEQLGLVSVLIPLDQDLADTNSPARQMKLCQLRSWVELGQISGCGLPAAVPQTSLHRLARAHDRNSADLSLKSNAVVLEACLDNRFVQPGLSEPRKVRSGGNEPVGVSTADNGRDNP